MIIHRPPIAAITQWLTDSAGDAPGSPNTIPWRIAKISEEIGEVVEAYRASDMTATRHELCDVILTAEVAAFSIDPDTLPRPIEHPYEFTRDGGGYLLDIVSAAGRASAALSGMIGRNPRKGVTHTPQQTVQALHDLAQAAATMLAAFEHPHGPQSFFNAHLERVVQRIPSTQIL
ncbi:MazG-like family protein [Nonomuraea sp. NPDC023979]|uniref:MazG-like family protein n=1 Tax=Nonomuraea sp. NPDC023979 TaxID=3154796 RepID=UPI0034088BFA